jgi:hypothetical protein
VIDPEGGQLFLHLVLLEPLLERREVDEVEGLLLAQMAGRDEILEEAQQDAGP